MAVMNPYNYSKPKNFMNLEGTKPKTTAPVKSNGVSDKMDQYLESKINSARPEELTFMLYEGMVKFIKKAMLHLENKNFEQVNYNTQRAQAILDELRGTLNMEITLSGSLESLYEYMSFTLINANIDKSEALFGEALAMAEDFRDTWKQAFGIRA